MSFVSCTCRIIIKIGPNCDMCPFGKSTRKTVYSEWSQNQIPQSLCCLSCMPAWWARAIIKPWYGIDKYQHVSNNQNVLWCLIEDIVGLSIQAVKSKSSSCSRKNPFMSCGPFARHCWRQTLENENWSWTYKVHDCMSSMKQELHQVFLVYVISHKQSTNQ